VHDLEADSYSAKQKIPHVYLTQKFMTGAFTGPGSEPAESSYEHDTKIYFNEASRHATLRCHGVVLTPTFLLFHAEGISRGVLWDR
jgi:hypothetical protein